MAGFQENTEQDSYLGDGRHLYDVYGEKIRERH